MVNMHVHRLCISIKGRNKPIFDSPICSTHAGKETAIFIQFCDFQQLYEFLKKCKKDHFGTIYLLFLLISININSWISILFVFIFLRKLRAGALNKKKNLSLIITFLQKLFNMKLKQIYNLNFLGDYIKLFL